MHIHFLARCACLAGWCLNSGRWWLFGGFCVRVGVAMRGLMVGWILVLRGLVGWILVLRGLVGWI